METIRFKNWWFLAVNGLIFITLGGLLLFLTKESILTIIKYFGIFLLAGSVVLLFIGINNIRKDKSAAMLLIEAIAGTAIGLALLLFPQPTLDLFLMLIGIWAIIIGIIQLVIIVNTKGALVNKNAILINGLLTIALGIFLLFKPFDWAIFMGKIIGICAAIFGIMLVYLGFVLRAVKTNVTHDV